MKKNFWCILALLAVLGISQASALLMVMPGGGMGGSRSFSGTSVAAPGGGFPLIEVGLGIAILAVGYWWLEIRGRPKRGQEGLDAQEGQGDG